MRPYFKDTDAARLYVGTNTWRKVRNLIARRTRQIERPHHSFAPAQRAEHADLFALHLHDRRYEMRIQEHGEDQEHNADAADDQDQDI